jgi:hypothetical protein
MRLTAWVGRFNLMDPAERSLTVAVKAEGIDVALIGLSPAGAPADGEPWTRTAEAAAREVCGWFFTTQRADAELLLAWLAVDENHDALYDEWARGRRAELARRRGAIEAELARLGGE